MTASCMQLAVTASCVQTLDTDSPQTYGGHGQDELWFRPYVPAQWPVQKFARASRHPPKVYPKSVKEGGSSAVRKFRRAQSKSAQFTPQTGHLSKDREPAPSWFKSRSFKEFLFPVVYCCKEA
jgi:hypothetical protein